MAPTQRRPNRFGFVTFVRFLVSKSGPSEEAGKSARAPFGSAQHSGTERPTLSPFRAFRVFRRPSSLPYSSTPAALSRRIVSR
jgi:hypothetical protein